MIICKVCGTQNEAGASFCGSCGSYLEWSGEAYDPDGSAKATPDQPAKTVPGQPAGAVPGQPAGTTPTPTGQPAGTAPDQPAGTTATPTGQATPPAVSPVPPPAAAGSIVCPNCGEANDPTRVFCRRCATELAPPSAVVAPVVAGPPRRRSGPPIAVLGGVAAIAVVAVVAALVVLPRGTPTASSATGTSAPSTSASGAPGASADGSPATPTDLPAAASATPAAPSGVIVFSAGDAGEYNLFTWDAATREVSPLFESPGSIDM